LTPTDDLRIFDQYVETVERLKEDLPADRVVETEVVIQLAGYKMDHEAVKTGEESGSATGSRP